VKLLPDFITICPIQFHFWHIIVRFISLYPALFRSALLVVLSFEIHYVFCHYQADRLDRYESTKQVIIKLVTELDLLPSSEFERAVVSGDADSFVPTDDSMKQLQQYRQEVRLISSLCFYCYIRVLQLSVTDLAGGLA